MIPYEDNQVTEILIEGAPDWTPVKRGSFEAVLVSKEGSPTEEATPKRWGIRAIDKMDGSQVFCYVERLVAVKYTTEEDIASGITPRDGRLLP